MNLTPAQMQDVAGHINLGGRRYTRLDAWKVSDGAGGAYDRISFLLTNAKTVDDTQYIKRNGARQMRRHRVPFTYED